MQLTVSNKDYLENIFNDIRRAAQYPLNIEYTTAKRLKTKSQLGFIFGGLMGVLRQYFYDIYGVLYDVDDLKYMLYWETGVFTKTRFPNGLELPTPITLSKMTKEQASEFITKALEYMETFQDLIIPPDLRNCWLTHVTKENIEEARNANLSERAPEYLAYQNKQSCLNCGKYDSDAHHVKSNQYGGLAVKPPDWFSISLCNDCHIGNLHQHGQTNFLKGLNLYGFEIEIYCRLAYLRWYLKAIR